MAFYVLEVVTLEIPEKEMGVQEEKNKKERETIYQDFHKTRRKTVILIVVSRVLFRKKFVFI